MTQVLEKPRIVITGRKVVGGIAEGEALVTLETISGWGGVNPATGTVIESRHELKGQSFAGKVLVFPGAKGSSGWSSIFHMAKLRGMSPVAMIFNIMTTKAALGAVVMRTPTVTECDSDPLDHIRTGDWVRVDGDAGTISVWDRKPG